MGLISVWHLFRFNLCDADLLTSDFFQLLLARCVLGVVYVDDTLFSFFFFFTESDHFCASRCRLHSATQRIYLFLRFSSSFHVLVSVLKASGFASHSWTFWPFLWVRVRRCVVLVTRKAVSSLQTSSRDHLKARVLS